MADYTIFNGTEAQLADVNAGGTDVESLTFKNGVTLTDGELAALCAQKGVAVTSDLTAAADAAQIKRVIAVASRVAST